MVLISWCSIGPDLVLHTEVGSHKRLHYVKS